MFLRALSLCVFWNKASRQIHPSCLWCHSSSESTHIRTHTISLQGHSWRESSALHSYFNDLSRCPSVCECRGRISHLSSFFSPLCESFNEMFKIEELSGIVYACCLSCFPYFRSTCCWPSVWARTVRVRQTSRRNCMISTTSCSSTVVRCRSLCSLYCFDQL